MTVSGTSSNNPSSVPLGKLLTGAQSGFASGARDPNGVVQMRMNNVNTDGNLDWTSFIRVPTSQEQLDKYHLRVVDVLFNSTNSPDLVGKTAVFDGFPEPVVFSNHFIRLRADETRLNPRYLSRWLTHQWQRRVFESLCTQWVNQASVRKDDLLSLTIPLPPLPEQQRIARIRAKADRLRCLRRTARELSDTYLQSVFLEMFGDPVSNPMGWEKTSVKAVADIIVPTRDKPKSFSGEIPWVTLPDLDGLFISDAQHLLTHEEAAEVKNRLMPTGTVLLSCAGSLGKVAVTTRQIYANQQFYGLVADANQVDNLFLAMSLMILGEECYFRLAGVSTLGFFSKAKALGIEISLPPLPLQQQFAAIVHKFERLRAQQREAERQAEHLFQALLERAFTRAGL